MTSKAKAVVFCVLMVCLCVVCCVGIRANADKIDGDGCCGKCDCAKAWKRQAEINVSVIDHLRRNGVVIGSPAPVGSAK